MLKYCLQYADKFDKILNVGRLITTEPARVALFDNKIGIKSKYRDIITVLILELIDKKSMVYMLKTGSNRAKTKGITTMKKETIKTAANTASNTASNTTTAAKNPSNMTISELQALKSTCKGVMLAVIEALITEKTKSAELQAKVKTSAKREPKAPDTYDILQPVFVALRGSINKGITADENIIAIFQYAVHALKITFDENIQKRLFEKTVLHNSCSNIAKADSIKSAEGRKSAFEEMLHQAMVMLPKVTEAEWIAYKKEYNTAYNKAVAKLK